MAGNATQKATTLEQFAMLAERAKSYTDTEIQGKLTYTHQQNTAASVWNVTHNLGRFPSVTVVDSAGSKIIGDVRYTSDNTVILSFSAPFAGIAYFN